MYAWIWRHLPFGLPGKISGSLLLAAGAAALLWFAVFPWLDPFVEQTLLPWNEGQMDGDFAPAGDPGGPDQPTVPGGPTEGPGEELVGPNGEVLEDEHDIPYETDE